MAAVKREGRAELLLHTAQKLQTIIDRRTELAFMLDELWELVDQITARLPDSGLVEQMRGDLRTDCMRFGEMELERVEKAIDDLRQKEHEKHETH
jgi:hypothetical protein